MAHRWVFARFRERAGWRVPFRFFLVLCSLELGYVSNAHAQLTITTIDAPGAGTQQSQGTTPTAINPAGAITGYFFDANWTGHAFLRSHEGIFTIVDGPGANSITGTVATAINPSGTITGYYVVDRPGCCPHEATTFGFVRTPDGAFTTFAVPGADGAGGGTVPLSINSSGAITGYCFPEFNASHSFGRNANGAIATFDPPNTHEGIGSAAQSINDEGAITGFYAGDTSQVSFIHGYLRSPDGTFTTFDAPGTPTETVPCCINLSGTIAGTYLVPDANGNTGAHPFLRASDGTITAFDFFASIRGINPRGSFVGSYATAGNPSQAHGYVRHPDGTFISFDAPGVGACSGSLFTEPTGVSPSGAITGWYEDANCANHGFLAKQ